MRLISTFIVEPVSELSESLSALSHRQDPLAVLIQPAYVYARDNNGHALHTLHTLRLLL